MSGLILANETMRLILLAVLFAAVVIVSYAIVSAVAVRRSIQQRLADGIAPRRSPRPGSLRNAAVDDSWARLVNAVEKSGISLLDTRDQLLRSRLAAAGYSAPYAPRIYTLVRLVLVIAVPMVLLGGLWLAGHRPGLASVYGVAVAAAVMGLYLPSLLIRAKADRRRQEVINSFPDALDLMLVCVEAGLGLEAAFDRVGREMTQSHPLLAEQFGRVVLEFRAGRSRDDALRRLADQAGVDELRAFATLLIQSTRLGSSIARTLRIYAAEMREKRRLRAEEKAHRLPVLLSIPLVACMLPVMVGVLMLPAVIRTVRAVLPALTGG